MKVKKLLEQFDDFFDLSKKKQKKKQDKLLKMIASLEQRKVLIKQEIKKEARDDKHSKACYSLCKEFKVINKLIKKAKKNIKN